VSELSPLQLGALGLDRGGLILLKRALVALTPGAQIEVCGESPELAVHLRAWARAQGQGFTEANGRLWLTREDYGRWRGAERAGGVAGAGVVEHPKMSWGLAARGALVEAGPTTLHFPLAEKSQIWAEEAGRLYAQAAAAQWDPATEIPWDAEITHPEEVEDAVVQVMTYLIENETAALLVPARFLGQLHPHFREVMQLLAITAADEARHIEVFTRRACLRRETLGLSTHGGQASLQTLLEEPDFALASFLLSVLGEGSFLSLLWFLQEHAPDVITRQVCRLAAQDEARHVAFGLAHLSRHVTVDPGLRGRLAQAIQSRNQALAQTAGLNEEVFEALVILAAGSFEPEAIARGHDRVLTLQHDMDHGRRLRLERLGFSAEEAAALSALHTRNFM
jgi:hypothetical protein